MKTISLRVDVDTLSGSLEGIPALLRMLDRQQMRASFYFCFGPDNSGKAIRRICSPRQAMAERPPTWDELPEMLNLPETSSMARVSSRAVP